VATLRRGLKTPDTKITKTALRVWWISKPLVSANGGKKELNRLVRRDIHTLPPPPNLFRFGGGDNQLWDDPGNAVRVLDLIAQFQVLANAFAVCIKICIEFIRFDVGQLREAAVAGADDVGDGGFARPGQA